MARKAIVWLLLFVIPLASPGADGWLAFAGDVSAQYDPLAHRLVGTSSTAQTDILRALKNPELLKKLPPEQVQQAIALVQRYPQAAGDPETAAALRQAAQDLADPKKDPALVMQSLYDDLQGGARDESARETETVRIGQTNTSQTVAVRDNASGKVLFIQRSKDVEPYVNRRTILREDPKTHQQVIDAIVDVDQKDVLQTQHVVYNRKMQEFLRTLRQFYYDQCPLVRKINNGGMNYGMGLSDTGCTDEQGGPPDDKVTKKAIAEMRKVYDAQQAKFNAEMKYTDSQGRPRNVMDYLKEMEDAEAHKALDQLDWRDLQAVQRVAMRFYSENELITLQKYVLIQLTSFFSQITNSQPKGDKEGVQDASLKDNTTLQNELGEIEKGHLQDYDWVMQAAIKAAHLSAQDQKFVPKSLYDATGEAMSYLGYAVKTNVAHAFDAGVSGEEQDAIIDEAQHWIKLAQIQLQTFEASSLAIQMERLKSGELSEHLGLTDADSKAEADRLAEQARAAYLPKLSQENQETKAFLLKESVTNLFQTAQNVEHAHLTQDNLSERLRAMSAKLLEIRFLFLAKQFERFKDRADLNVQASVLDKMQNAPAYTLFIKKVESAEGSSDRDLAAVAAMASMLQQLSDTLKGLAQQPDRDKTQLDLDRLKQVLMALDPEFQDGLPTPHELDEQSKRMAVKWAHFNQAYQTFSTQIRMFDMVNEMDLYARKYMSSEKMHSDSQGWLSRTFDLKRLDSWFNVGGGRDATGDWALEHSPLASNREAWRKLIANQAARKKALELMNQGDFNAAMQIIAGLDPESAERAAKEAAADKAQKDPFESFDFESAIVSQPDDDLAVRAQGATIGCFQSLQSGILGFMAATGVYDMAVTSVVTAGVGQLAKVFFFAADIAAAAAEALQAMKRVETAGELSRIARVVNLAIDMVKSTFGYASRMFTAWGNNTKNITQVRELGGTAKTPWKQIMANAWGRTALKQGFFSSLPNVFVRTAKTQATIAMASAGMSVGQHLYEGQGSQFRSVGDALEQGALGGMSFGGKAGLLFMFSPIQATAMGNGAFGRLLSWVAETPGPVSGSTQLLAKIVPEWSAKAMAGPAGVLGSMAESAVGKTALQQWGIRAAVYNTGMVDGALKFMAIAAVPKWVAEEAAMGGPKWQRNAALAAGAVGLALTPVLGAPAAVLGGAVAAGIGLPLALHSGLGLLHGPDLASDEEPADGTTSFMRRLSGAHTMGLDVAQMSWLILPMQSMQGTAADTHQQMDQMLLFNRALREGKAKQFTVADGGKVTVERPLWHRFLSREAFWKKSGRAVELDKTDFNRKIANREVLRDADWSTLVAAGMADPGEVGGMQKISTMVDGLASGQMRTSRTAGSAAPAELSEEGRLAQSALKDLSHGKGRLYAYYDKAGKLEDVTVKPEAARSGAAVEFDVGADGRVELAHQSDGKLTRDNVEAARDFGAERFKSAEDAFRKAVAEAKAAPEAEGSGEAQDSQRVAPGSDDLFVTNETPEAANELIEERLDKSPQMRRSLQRAQGTIVDSLSRDAGAREKLAAQFDADHVPDAVHLQFSDDETGLTFKLDLVSKKQRDGKVVKNEIAERLWSALAEKRGEGAVAMGRRLAEVLKSDPRLAAQLSEASGVSFVLQDPKTGQKVKLGGRYLRRMREIAETSELNRKPMTAREYMQMIVFGDDGGHSVFKGRLWKSLTGRPLDTKAQILAKQAKVRAADALFTMAKQSPEQRLPAIGRSVDDMARAAGSEAAALKPLQDAAASGSPERLRQAIRTLAGGVEPSQLLSLKRALLKDRPAPAKIADALSMIKGWGEAPAAGRLKAVFETPFKTDAEAGKIVDSAMDLLSNKIRPERGEKPLSPGATLESLDVLDRRASGQITEDDLTQTVQAAMDGLIARAKGDARRAMEDLRPTLESDAFLQLANDRTVEAITGFKKNDPAAAARLEEAKRVLIGTWERGVFGQRYAERVLKTRGPDGKPLKDPVMVWEVPAERQFRDMFDHQIPSFRPHQREAIENDLDLFARGDKRMYDLMKTSGGKTLLGFVLVSFLERYSLARGREGVYYVTTDAGLVKQARDNYLAMFKGRKPSFEIIKYEDLFQKEATAKLMGTISPLASHEVYGDELDQVGLGTPLSLGKFNGTLRFAGIDPVQQALRDFVAKAGLGKDDQGKDVVCTGLCAEFPEFFRNQRLENPEELEALLSGDSPAAKAHPEKLKELRQKMSDLESGLQKEFGKKRAEVQSSSFLDKIPEDYARDYAKKNGYDGPLDAKTLRKVREQIRAEMLKDYDTSFGNWHHVGVFEAKYGSNNQWLDKILKSALMAGTWGDKLAATFKVDEERHSLGSIVNDAYLESLDTHTRSALELWKGLPLTNDFETGVVVKLRDLLESARRNDTALIGASGTQPAELEDFLEQMDVVTIGEGSPVDKVEKQSTHRFLQKNGQIPYTVDGNLAFLAKGGRTNPETGQPALNLVVDWVPDDAAADRLIAELGKKGVRPEEIAVRMTPGSDYWLQNRYKLSIKDLKNDEGLKQGKVRVALMVGQGGFRGHEMPLDAYAGGEIKMFVLDSYTLTDVGSVQLMGRIDGGRIPKGTETHFEMLDDFNTLINDRFYRDEMPAKVDKAISGNEQAERRKLQAVLDQDKSGKLPFSQATFDLIMSKPGHAQQRRAYRDYLAFTRLQEAVKKTLGERQMAELAKLGPNDPKRAATVEKLMRNEDVAHVLVIEMRRSNESRALAASGVTGGGEAHEAQAPRGRGPSLLDRLRSVIPGAARQSAPVPAPAS